MSEYSQAELKTLLEIFRAVDAWLANKAQETTHETHFPPLCLCASVANPHNMKTDSAPAVWVSVKERLPAPADLNEDGDVLVCWGNECHFMAVAKLTPDGNGHWLDSGPGDGPIPDVTHWMKLPLPPPNI